MSDDQEVGGIAVESVRDLGQGTDTAEPDGRVRLPWRAGDMMVTLRLAGGATLTLRASGEEAHGWTQAGTSPCVKCMHSMWSPLQHVVPPAACGAPLHSSAGTEPKLKFYLEVTGQDPVLSTALADRIERAVSVDIVRAEENGLKLPSQG